MLYIAGVRIETSNPEGIRTMNYSLAFEGPGNQTWDIVENFTAANNAAANDWAEENYPESDWYVLDENGENING